MKKREKDSTFPYWGWWGRWDSNEAHWRLGAIHRHFYLRSNFPFFLLLTVWYEVKIESMSRKVVACPYCGRLMPEHWLSSRDHSGEVGEGGFVKHKGIMCPRCGCTRVWKDGRYFSSSGEDRQRYLCRKCEYRFSVKCVLTGAVIS